MTVEIIGMIRTQDVSGSQVRQQHGEQASPDSGDLGTVPGLQDLTRQAAAGATTFLATALAAACSSSSSSSSPAAAGLSSSGKSSNSASTVRIAIVTRDFTNP
jgi:hypothetical protein